MKSKSMLMSLGIMMALAILATGVAISAQYKYTVKVPNGLAFSEFRGYPSNYHTANRGFIPPHSHG